MTHLYSCTVVQHSVIRERAAVEAVDTGYDLLAYIVFLNPVQFAVNLSNNAVDTTSSTFLRLCRDHSV